LVVNKTFCGFLLTLVSKNGLFHYKAKSESRELIGLCSTQKEKALFNIQFDILCEEINNYRKPAIVSSPFTNPSQKYLNLSAKKALGKDYDFPSIQKPRLYIDGNIEIYDQEKTIKVCNKIYDTDPQIIVTTVIGIYDPSASIKSSKLVRN
jgi:hypothetical protein